MPPFAEGACRRPTVKCLMNINVVPGLLATLVSLRRLAHQPRLQPHVGIAHVAVDLGAWDEGGDGVDDDEIDAGALGE